MHIFSEYTLVAFFIAALSTLPIIFLKNKVGQTFSFVILACSVFTLMTMANKDIEYSYQLEMEAFNKATSLETIDLVTTSSICATEEKTK